MRLVQLQEEHLDSTQKLVEISSNLQFVDRDQWPSIEDLAKGYDDYLPPKTAKLDGKSLTLFGGPDGTSSFQLMVGDVFSWKGEGSKVSAPGDVFEMRPGVFYLTFADSEQSTERTLVFDQNKGRGWLFESSLTENERGIRTRTATSTVALPGQQPQALERTSKLVGKHALHRYNDRDWYEHFYLNSGTFSWHCLRGIERGAADTENCAHYEVADGLYILNWTESNLPVESVVLVDFSENRSVGRFFCWEKSVNRTVRMVFGAYSYIANSFQYPALPDN